MFKMSSLISPAKHAVMCYVFILCSCIFRPFMFGVLLRSSASAHSFIVAVLSVLTVCISLMAVTDIFCPFCFISVDTLLLFLHIYFSLQSVHFSTPLAGAFYFLQAWQQTCCGMELKCSSVTQKISAHFFAVFT